MTTVKSIATGFALTLAVAGTVFGGIATPAEAAGKGRDVYVQDYQFSGPKHGFEGRALGGAYCSYQRIPNRKCKWVNGREVCKIKGWTLRQMCQ